ncbi:MAG TPA: phosphoribosylformylglycinamidine synthase subunit PurQ [Pirellulales bacterium]|nr:phosphoribosylformylglycinamidine synthase subunit PurQ [Pirellulales bacterium]
MAQPRILILRAPGTNCDGETAYAFSLARGRPELLHINRLLERPALLNDYQILCLPGGFSYGDDIASGRILANQLRRHLGEPLARFRESGKLILGICNGFQILIQSGLLLDDDPQFGPPATLAWNASGKFEDRWVRLRADNSKCVFLAGIERMYLPVAHGEGRLVVREAARLAEFERDGQLVLHYAGRGARGEGRGASEESRGAGGEGRGTNEGGQGARNEGRGASGCNVAYPDNPNGSTLDVAGLCDPSGRVFGLMPHPERYVDPTQHPRWTRGEAQTPGDGLRVFANAVAYFE